MSRVVREAKKMKMSKSRRANVLFPVGRMHRYLKKGTHKFRIGTGAPVYMAAVIEYLTGKFIAILVNKLIAESKECLLLMVKEMRVVRERRKLKVNVNNSKVIKL